MDEKYIHKIDEKPMRLHKINTEERKRKDIKKNIILWESV